MSFLRFLMLLSLVAWIGGLMFFAFVLAPTVFAPGVLPNTHLAGNIVGRALGKLHWIAIISGIVFLASSLLYSRLTEGTAHVFALRHVLICLMLGLTLLSQFWIIPRMDTLRASVSDFATVPLDNPARAQFDALHVWSTRVEGACALIGLGCDLLNCGRFLPAIEERRDHLCSSGCEGEDAPRQPARRQRYFAEGCRAQRRLRASRTSTDLQG